MKFQMEKSVVRSLPPLVQGKLTGVFELAIEKIKITENIFKNDNSNLLVKVLWWGETKPLFVRPNKIQFITRDNNEVTINEPGEHSVKYEVHTHIKLFKSYLEKCEVVELVILNSLQNEVIGSTFLCDLIHLIFYIQFFNGSVINHSGDSIGEIYCHLSFKEANTEKSVKGIETNAKVSPIKKWSASNLKINLNTLNLHSSRQESDTGSEVHLGNNSNRVFHEFSTFNKDILMDDLHSERNSNLHYNSPVTQNSQLKVDSNFNEICENSLDKIKLINDHLKNPSFACVNSKQAINLNPPPMDTERSEKPLLTDSSKIVCKANFPVEPHKSLQVNVKDKKKVVNKSKNTHAINKRQEQNVNKNKSCNTSAKIINKKIVTSKVKSYIENKAQKNKNICTEGAFAGSKKSLTCGNLPGNQKHRKITNGAVKPTSNVKSFIKVSNEISKLNKLYLNSSRDFNNDDSDLEKVPVKDVGGSACRDAEVHNTLEDTNKKGQDNEKNTNMTKSFGNCKSIKANTKDYKSEKFDQNKEQSERPTNLGKVKIDNKLRFDLNNPIEKIYYETFFLKTENVCTNEFEIAELLNQPENKYMLEVNQGRVFGNNASTLPGKGDGNSQNIPFSSDEVDKRKDDIKNEEKLADPPEIRKDEEDCRMKCELLESAVTGSVQDSDLKSKSPREYKMNCHRCKYYKKLSELDKIIESLRIFETKLKNEVVLSSLNLNADDSSKNFTGGRPLLDRRPNHPGQTVKGDECRRIGQGDEELALVLDNNDGSDFSKDDSDFIEFRHYLSKR